MISLLIARACVAFVLSLPISATRAGQTLRRWAGVLFLLALAPALFVGKLAPPKPSSEVMEEVREYDRKRGQQEKAAIP